MSGRGKSQRGIAPPTPSVIDALMQEVTHPGNLKLAFHGGIFLLSIYLFREVRIEPTYGAL